MKNSRKKLIVMGDRILIEPDEGKTKTNIGLYLPQTVQEKEQIRSGTIVATGPGLPLPDPNSMEDEPWKQHESFTMRHLPMQAQVGDTAIFLKKAAFEIKYEEKTYLVIPQAAILVLLRDENPLPDMDI